MTIIEALKDKDVCLEIKHKTKSLYWSKPDNHWVVEELVGGIYYNLYFDNEEQAVKELLKP